ncbi:DUF2231 domain-containing protein [Aerosakkonemataceae cyanobacterium BLCC-F50]|uniref:DUF2231 domain-containing protein n=1 Tax=Floridaenema flaviceps BLCC-F50 TaxID=3153642 RepID=A0ABV4XJ81_9CYAN
MITLLLGLTGIKVGANGLPYSIPIHPQLVHLTLGLVIIAIAFDIAGTLFPLGKPIFKFLALPAIRSSFYEVGWYNLLAAAIVTFFTVAAGFFELMLAKPPTNKISDWGLNANLTMLFHGLGGILLLTIICAMTVWRGFQRYRSRSVPLSVSRKDRPREVQWSYLLVGIVLLGVLYIHGTLGAQLGDEFGIHNTAANLLKHGKNPNEILIEKSSNR